MAFPATKTILAMKDTSAPGLTIKVTGYQWKWGYDYLQEGFGFYSNLSTPLAQIENRAAEGRALPARGRQPAGRSDRHQGARADHRRRRAPRVVGAGVRRQAGRDSRLRPRFVVQGREDRHLPRPVRRALRQGARLHADRRRGEIEGRLTRSGSTSRRRRLAAAGDDPNKVWDSKRLVVDRRADLRGQLRRVPPGRTARACRARSRRSTARRSSTGPKARRSRWC